MGRNPRMEPAPFLEIQQRLMSALNKPYFDLEVDETPLALVGDYFEGTDVDAAYRSGYKLAQHWIEKYDKK
jgi:predicted NAD/FAD-dependent oxidoreductase